MGTFFVIDNFKFDAPKTKLALSLLKGLGVSEKKTLVILEQANDATFKSFRNIPRVTLLSRGELETPTKWFNHEVVVMAKDALNQLTEAKAKVSSKKGRA